MSIARPQRMTADEFLAWAATQPAGERYELANGEVVAMAPERAGHARTKARVLRALEDALRTARVDCEAFPDGMAVRVDDSTVYEPDALVRCGGPLPDEAIELGDPVVVVEVLSPSTRARDSGAKLADYVRLRSLRHYLLVRTDTRVVIHHARTEEGRIETSIVSSGRLRLEPPGIELPLEALFPSLE